MVSEKKFFARISLWKRMIPEIWPVWNLGDMIGRNYVSGYYEISTY